MSEQTENLQAMCVECKSDLSKDVHKEDCPISLKQKAEFADKIRLENEKAEHDKREAEQIEQMKKDKALEDAKKELEEKSKKEIQRQADELKKKQAVLAKIRKLLPNENFKDSDVLSLALPQIFELYNKVLSTLKDEKTNAKMEYDVSCPLCHEFLGESSDINGAKILQKEHKKKAHPLS
ncbi:MAG: hypothetical protein ACREBJ_06580, partial [Nitrosotalea sp.]